MYSTVHSLGVYFTIIFQFESETTVTYSIEGRTKVELNELRSINVQRNSEGDEIW